MKSIVYILITVFISSILISAFPNFNKKEKQIVTIQCVDENFSQEKLLVSAEIIKSRLKDYGLQDYVVSINEPSSGLNISFNSNVDLSALTALLTSAGNIEFYETHDRMDLIQKIENEHELFSIMNIPVKKREVSKLNSRAILGYSVGDNRQVIKDKLGLLAEKGIITNDIQFSWSKYSFDNLTFELFLLKNGCNLNGDYVDNSIGRYYDNGNADIIISFDEHGTNLWHEMTKRSIGKSIAIVIDGEVYHAPKVMFEIKEGKCRISGYFSTDEANKLISLINNGTLPLNFELKN